MIHSTFEEDPVNSFLTVLMTVLLFLTPVLIWTFLIKKQKNLEEEDFKPRF